MRVDYFLAASAVKNCKKHAVSKSAGSAASTKGGCASSRLDHGLKFYVIWGGCASSRLISEFSDSASAEVSHTGIGISILVELTSKGLEPVFVRFFDFFAT